MKEHIICRKAKELDIPKIMSVIQEAKEFMKVFEMDQWQNGYPDDDAFRCDIANGECYVAVDGEMVAGVIVVAERPEECYADIVGKGWNDSSEEYWTIHRMAVGDRYRGTVAAKELIAFAEELCRQNHISSLRTDTHEKNKAMQRFLQKQGFVYCGEVNYDNMEGDTLRVAYEKTVFAE